MEPHEAITCLERLRGEAYTLQGESRGASDLCRWHNDVFEALTQIYGQESPEKCEFEQISFGMPPEMLERGPEKLRVDLQQHGINLPESFIIPQTDHNQKFLTTAAEFLFGLIITLRHG